MRTFWSVLLVFALVLGLSPVPATAATDPVEDLGTPLTSLTIMKGVVGHDPDGSDVVYAVPAGENARLNIVDLHTKQLKKAIPLPGASGAWAITIASDGNVYVGSYSNGRLYRYSPATGSVTDLGQPIAGEAYIYGLTPGENGVIYGGTYPNTHAFRYDPAGGGKVTDFGTLDTVQQYVRATAYDPDHKVLYAGLLSPHARLFRIDVTTGEKREITPAGFTGNGYSDLDYANGRVFGNVDNQLVVFDAATGQQVTYRDPTGAAVQRFPIIARGVSPVYDGSVYFTSTASVLYRYDLATDAVIPVTDNGKNVTLTRGAAIAYGWMDEDGGPKLYGLAGNYSGGTYRFDPATGGVTQWSSPFEYVPVPLMNVLADPSNGKVFVNAYLNGSTVVYDPATGTSTATARSGQVEDWTWSGDKVYFGTYPSGQLSVWDPHSTAAPQLLFSLKEAYEQNRPVAVVPHDGKLFVGTTPDYGLYGGALTIYDLATGSLTVHRNIVTDQTVASILPVAGKIWAGSSVDGGQGTEPRATEAVLFQFDPATGQKTAEIHPVAGAQSINELTIGPDGNIWGLADGTVFVVQPSTGKVLRRISMFTADTGAQDGSLVWRDGYLYGVTGSRLFMVDALSGKATVLRTGGSLLRLAPAPDGRMYLVFAVAGESNRTHLGRYTPPADPCPNSDLRAHVWMHGHETKIPNRFVTYGCTLADYLG
ncbi:PQQ-binding-like beta-propeller repeat protein [Fodinicola acaciae]|uniref:outer membrane protein assembly factor BamB family protein n=1 Tax=Fodinicola acaciae TaxID=2681555 RepID=UPI001C9E29D7|nr:PQQ-binding-like beta-propeller repeat protein [Fodinicola acaciae]